MNKLIPVLATSMLLMGAACSSDDASSMNNISPAAGQTAQHATPTGDCPDRLSPAQAANSGQSQCADPSAAPGTPRSTSP